MDKQVKTFILQGAIHFQIICLLIVAAFYAFEIERSTDGLDQNHLSPFPISRKNCQFNLKYHVKVILFSKLINL